MVHWLRASADLGAELVLTPRGGAHSCLGLQPEGSGILFRQGREVRKREAGVERRMGKEKIRKEIRWKL